MCTLSSISREVCSVCCILRQTQTPLKKLVQNKRVLCLARDATFSSFRQSVASQSADDGRAILAKKFILKGQTQGEPKEDDLELVEEILPPLRFGEILCEALWLSADTYFSYYTEGNQTMLGSQVARVVESNTEEFAKGDLIFGEFGWRNKTIFNVNHSSFRQKPYRLPDFGNHTLSLGLGVLGMPGYLAYFGLLELCRPKPGEIVVVSEASETLGSIVGQIARIKGCRVVGLAGSDDKVRWLKEELRFDAAYNYESTDINSALQEVAPNGVDCYFESVGETINSVGLHHIRKNGRIAMYVKNDDQSEISMKEAQQRILSKEILVERFMGYRWLNRRMESIQQNLQWVNDGHIAYRQIITGGFENLPKVFLGIQREETVGQQIVKA